MPFHFWCPDVYQGAPTPVTALLSVLPKAAGLAIMLRFFYGAFSAPGTAPWDLAGSIDWADRPHADLGPHHDLGNVAALTQTNMKRLLAYSSIAHAGYLLMGVVALSENGARGLLVYLAAYLFMNLGAFLVVTLVHLHEGTLRPARLRRALPARAAPDPGDGLLPALARGHPAVHRLPRASCTSSRRSSRRAGRLRDRSRAVNAAIAAYYYFRVLKVMTIDAGNEDKPALSLALADRAWLVAFALANLVPLLFWGRIEGWARSALVLYAGR